MRAQTLFGLRFVDEPSVDVVVAELTDGPPPPAPAWRSVVTPNVDHLVRYAKSPVDRAVAERATVVLPDGSPVIWSSRLLRRPLRARLTGADLFHALWRQLIAGNRAIVVVAANAGIANALETEHPRARCIVAPMFDADDSGAIDALAAQVHAAVESSGAEYVLLGVSMPKHHRLCSALTALPAPTASPWVLLLGASAEFHVGARRRAPRWMQRAGLEWLHRLASNPRQMARRYLVDDVAFVPLVWREWRAQRR